MDYDDYVRRYNFLSGLALGAVLGVGLTLVLRHERRRTSSGLALPGADRLRQGLAATIRAGREHLQR